jgi:hypothetical protein
MTVAAGPCKMRVDRTRLASIRVLASVRQRKIGDVFQFKRKQAAKE